MAKGIVSVLLVLVLIALVATLSVGFGVFGAEENTAENFIVETASFVPNLEGKLISHYKFNEDTKDSVGDNNGVTEGVPKFVEGKFDGAALFESSNDYVKVSDFQGLSSEELSVSVWVKMEDCTNYNNFVVHEWKNNGWILYCGQDQRVRFGISQNNVKKLAYSGSLSGDVWHHVAGTYDGATMKIYIDGLLHKSNVLEGAVLDNNGVVEIGGREYLSSALFIGELDDVRIYDYALDADEIKELASA